VAKAKAEIEKIIKPLVEEKRIQAEAERLAIEAADGDDAGAWGGAPADDDADGW